MRRIVYLEWVDSHTVDGWLDDDEVKKDCKMSKICSVGYLVSETDKEITITTSYWDDEVMSPLTIPKRAILKCRKKKIW